MDNYSKFEKKTGTIMYVFLKGISALLYGLKDKDAVDLITRSFETVKKDLTENEVTYYKTFGAGIIAFFEDKGGNGESAHKASLAALEINKGYSNFDDLIFKKYGKEVKCAVGISYGECLIGDIGSNEGFAALGDSAHEASELGREAPMGNVYITKQVYEFIKKDFEVKKNPDMLYLDKSCGQIPVFTLEKRKENESFFNLELDLGRKQKYELHILGCRGSYQINGKRFTEFGGETTCSIIKTGRHAVVIDCGTGFNMAGSTLNDCDTIDVLLSHVHYDHCIGLLNWSAFPTGVIINFYGNFDKWLGENTLNEMLRPPFWPVAYASGNMNQIEYGTVYDLGDDIKVSFFEANHPNAASLMSIDIGKSRICNMVDCEKADAMPLEVLKNADLLIYDGMYDDSEYGQHVGWGHSTWQEGCKLAKEAKVKKLLVSHHSPTATDQVLIAREEKARKKFKNTTFARSGMVIKF